MFAKLTLIIVLVAVTGAVLLNIRQERILLMNEIVDLHSQINTDRQTTWDLQVRNSELLTPQKLTEAIEARGMDLVPITPTQAQPPRQLVEGFNGY